MQLMNRAMLVGALLTLGAASAGAQETKEWKWRWIDRKSGGWVG